MEKAIKAKAFAFAVNGTKPRSMLEMFMNLGITPEMIPFPR
jgi:hypothetical protein